MTTQQPRGALKISTTALGARKHSLLYQFNAFRRKHLTGYLFISPWLIGLIVFTLGPFIASLYLSFTRYSIVAAPEWIGFANYEKLFTDDPYFYKTLFNTLYYVVFHVPGVQVISLILALILAQDLRGIAIYRTVFYLPTVTSGVATAILWQWIFNSKSALSTSPWPRSASRGRAGSAPKSGQCQRLSS